MTKTFTSLSSPPAELVFFFFEPVPMAAGAEIVPPLHSAGAFIYRGVTVRSDGVPWRLSTWFLFPDTFYDGLLVEYSSKA